MNTIIAVGLLTMFGVPKDYPVRVRIEQVRTATHNGYTTGRGVGNVIKDGETQGFDYVFDGCPPFRASQGPDAYAARWKDAHDLVIQMVEIGSERTHECTLKVTVRNYVYVMKDGQLHTAPLKWHLRRDHATNE